MRILQSIFKQINSTPETDTTELIRNRAYELWEENGRPESNGVEFWLMAEEELTKGTK